MQQVSKAIKLRNLGQRRRNMFGKAGESDRAIRTKMVCIFLVCHMQLRPTTALSPAETLVRRQAEGWEDGQTMMPRQRTLSNMSFTRVIQTALILVRNKRSVFNYKIYEPQT
jgi:hypothetical protein